MNRQLQAPAAIAGHAILFLFLLQLLTAFIAAVYAFGLLGTSIPPEIAAVLFLFAPALWLLRRRPPPRAAYPVLAGIVVTTRVLGAMLDTRGRLLVTGVGTAAGLLWLVLLLWQRRQHQRRAEALGLMAALIGAQLLAILLRVLGSGSDISMLGATQVIGWILGIAALLLAVRESPALPSPETPAPAAPASKTRLVSAACGVISVMVLLYFGFAAPHVFARWTGAGVALILAAMLIALLAFCAVLAYRRHWLSNLGRAALWGWNGLFILALLGTILTHQMRFPATADGYPLYAPAASPTLLVPLLLMLLLSPVLFWDFALFAGEITRLRPSLPALGGAFTVGALYMVLLIFGHVFTTVYDYIPLVGPFFRDRFWLVHLLAGAGLLLPLLTVPDTALRWQPSDVGVNEPAPARRLAGGGVPAAVALCAIVILVGALLTSARPAATSDTDAVRVLTYNIQQGYSADGSFNFDGQLALIRDLDPDIIGLQESDTARIAGANDDVVRYFADRLDMYSYYGPSTVPGTFGIALLSKYPIVQPRTFYMYSAGEQTATIEAQIDAGFGPLRVFVTHLGNSGPLVQQEAILGVVHDLDAVVLMGDFNFRPDTEQYRLTTALLDDAWRRPAIDSTGPEPQNRIDHIFVSENIAVHEMRYVLDPASDHPAALAVLNLRSEIIRE